MKIAVVARPPVYGGKVATVQSADAEKVPGVERVIRLPGPRCHPASGSSAAWRSSRATPTRRFRAAAR